MTKSRTDEECDFRRIVVVSGTPYAGKTRFLASLREDPQFGDYSIYPRVTTRPKRLDKTESSEYTFVTIEEFQARQENGDFFVVEKNFGHMYGIPESAIQQALSSRGHSVFVTNVIDGFVRFRNRFPLAHLIFVSPVPLTDSMPYSKVQLEKILNGRIDRRGTPHACSRRELVDYCDREIRAVKSLPGVRYVLSEESAGDLDEIYARFGSAMMSGFRIPRSSEVS